MTEYKKDYYTRTFVDMLSTLELTLVQHEDGIGIADTHDNTNDGERFNSAADVVDYISEQIDNIRDQFEAAVLKCGLWDSWNEHCDGTFSYDAMLSFIDKHEDFKDEWAILIYEPTQMLINHLDDVDLELAMELTNEMAMDYNDVFVQVLDLIEFEVVKYDDGFGLVDNQGANLGNIEGDRFEDAAGILDRLGLYFDDYYFRGLEDVWEEKGYEGDMPAFAEDWVGCMNEHREFKEEYRHEYDVMNMIAYHANNVDLNKDFVKKLVKENKTQEKRGCER